MLVLQVSIAEGSIQNWCWSPLGWGMIFGLCCFAGWNIRILERGLQEYEALFMVAVFTASQVRRPLLLLSILPLLLAARAATAAGAASRARAAAAPHCLFFVWSFSSLVRL